MNDLPLQTGPLMASTVRSFARRAWTPLLWVGGAAVVLLTVALVVLSDGNPAVALAPAAAVGLLYALYKLPLRYSLMGLLFVALATESQNDSGGKWRSPLYLLGVMLHTNINVVVPIGALKLSGIDLLCALLGLVVLHRRIIGNRIDREGQIQTALPMGRYAVFALASLLLLWVWGMAHGGNLQQTLWQIRLLVLIPLVFFLFQAGLRGPRDFVPFAKTLIAAALVKALLAVWIRMTVVPNDTESLPTATSHADSALFVMAVTIVIVAFVERPDRKRFKQMLLVSLPIFFGMLANNRRLAFVELAAVLITVLLIAPRTNRVKRFVLRSVMMSIPVLAVYFAAGWNSGGGKLFKPVQMVRSILDSKSDRSTEDRDVENFNLIWTLKSAPLLGLGIGHEYIELSVGDRIDQIFPQYRYIPHNSVLGLWAFGGVIGFTGFWMITSVAVFLAARSYRLSREPVERAAALCVIAVVVVWGIHCYGDMGFTAWTLVFTLGPAMAVAGKLAVATGAWPARRAQSAPAP